MDNNVLQQILDGQNEMQEKLDRIIIANELTSKDFFNIKAEIRVDHEEQCKKIDALLGNVEKGNVEYMKRKKELERRLAIRKQIVN